MVIPSLLLILGYVQHAVPKPRKIVVTQSHGSPVILMSRAHCLLNTAELLTESIVREAGNFALELKHRVFPSFHASADLLEHRSTLLRHIRPNHTKGRSFSLRAPQNVVGLVQPTAGHRHSPHGQPHVSDAYIEQFSADLCTVSRASFSGSASSGSAASYCLSSNRSRYCSSLASKSDLRGLPFAAGRFGIVRSTYRNKPSDHWVMTEENHNFWTAFVQAKLKTWITKKQAKF